MKTKGGHRSKFLRIITIPIRALGKARDLYVRSMTSYATKVGYGTNYMGTSSTTSYATVLPRSFSANFSRGDDNEDLRELMRAASARTVAERMDINHLILQQQMMLMGQEQQSRFGGGGGGGGGGGVGPKGMPPRSRSVGMARIDEEKPYSVTAAGVNGRDKFGKSSSKKVQGMMMMMYPRSKSYGVNKKSLFSD